MIRPDAIEQDLREWEQRRWIAKVHAVGEELVSAGCGILDLGPIDIVDASALSLLVSSLSLRLETLVESVNQ